MSISNTENTRKLTDSIGRRMDYLRISLTDRCNLNCVYCKPRNSNETVDKSVLDESKIKRIMDAFALLGVRKIRFTGGEPLLNRSLPKLVAHARSLPNVETVGLTTNGTLLQEQLFDLVDAGLNRLNISLDSLKRETFKRITGRDMFNSVLDVIDDAVSIKELGRIKINTVVIRGFNDLELNDFTEWALPGELDLRFIEYMPTRFTGWGRERLVTESEMRDRIGYAFTLDRNKHNPSSTSRMYRVGSNPGHIGFISSISRSFCNTCNRLRLTSDGRLYGCLFRSNHIDLQSLLERDWEVERLAEHIRNGVARIEFKRDPGIKGEIFKPSMATVGG